MAQPIRLKGFEIHNRDQGRIAGRYSELLELAATCGISPSQVEDLVTDLEEREAEFSTVEDMYVELERRIAARITE